MKSLPLILLIASIITGTCFATTDATCLVYQPISMRSEGTVINLPENGFIIIPIPYLGGFSVPEKPYDVIGEPHKMLSMRKNQGDWDSNLVSRTGIKIQSNCTFEGNKMTEELVTVDLSKFQSSEDEPSIEVIVEATLECIRRTATDERQNWPRPVLKIIGRQGDEEKWKAWVELFNNRDFSKPFKSPQSVADPSSPPVIGEEFTEETRYIGFLHQLQYVETIDDLKKLIPDCPSPHHDAGDNNSEITVKTKLFGCDAVGEFNFHKNVLVSHGFQIRLKTYDDAHNAFLKASAILDSQVKGLKSSVALPIDKGDKDCPSAHADMIKIYLNGVHGNASCQLRLELGEGLQVLAWGAQKASQSEKSQAE